MLIASQFISPACKSLFRVKNVLDVQVKQLQVLHVSEQGCQPPYGVVSDFGLTIYFFWINYKLYMIGKYRIYFYDGWRERYRYKYWLRRWIFWRGGRQVGFGELISSSLVVGVDMRRERIKSSDVRDSSGIGYR